MKYILLTLAIWPYPVLALDYQPLQSNIDQFRGHYLYLSMQTANSSATVKQALTRWRAITEEAQTSDDPSEIEDITQYEIYRLGLKELVRLNYIKGNIAEGDLYFSRLEALTLVEQPTGLFLEAFCEKSCK